MRNSSLVEWLCAENVTGLKSIPKLRLGVFGYELSVLSRREQARMYKDLKVYERSYRLAVSIYRYAKTMPEEERYGLTSQLKRAATSIPLNIAEGYGKGDSKLEVKRYLKMAKGSCNEMEVLI